MDDFTINLEKIFIELMSSGKYLHHNYIELSFKSSLININLSYRCKQKNEG